MVSIKRKEYYRFLKKLGNKIYVIIKYFVKRVGLVEEE